MKKIKKILSLPLVLSLVLSLMLVPSFKVKALDGYTITGSQTARTTSSITVGWSYSTLPGSNIFWAGIGETTEAAAKDAAETTRKVTGNSITIDKLSNGNALTAGTKYVVCFAFRADESGERTACKGSINAVTTPSTPKNITQTSWTLGSDNLVLEWEQDGNADGYEVLYIDEDGDEIVKSVTEKTISLDTTNTSYFNVKIRAFTNYQSTSSSAATKIYSDYSTAFKAFAQPDIKETDDGYAVSVNKKKQLVVEYWKDKYAQGYEVWVATKKNGKYTKVKSTKNANTTKLVAKKYKGKKFKRNGRYWVTVVAIRKDANGKTNRTSSNYVVYYDKGETFLTIKKKSDITK